MISGSASRMLLRMLATVLPRQSVSSAISWSIRSDGFIGICCLEFLSRSHASSFAGASCLADLQNKSTKDMAFPHPQSREEHHRNDDKPNTGGVLWNVFKRTVDITEYRNAKDHVNPANNRTLDGIFHDCFVLHSRLVSRLGRPVGSFNTELLGVL